MPPQIIHLPDGQTFTVTPVFAGVGFRSHELNTHHHPFPVGWTTVLHTEEERVVFDAEAGGGDPAPDPAVLDGDADGDGADRARHQKRTRPFTRPTLQSDTLFISSISNPSNSEFKPAASPTRQIAMMLWVTLYWYFHQPEPSRGLHTEACRDTPDDARPAGDWKIYIRRDGVLRGRNLIPKLERMGLIASEDSAAGTSIDDGGDSWASMFVSRRMFWQIPGRLFLFTLQPIRGLSSYPGSPTGSRPGSPIRSESPGPGYRQGSPLPHLDLPGGPTPTTLAGAPGFPIGPFFSTSHLPTYYPPAALQYVFSDGVRHPLRPKPPRMGEVFYTRFVPSMGQYLSFRVASSSHKPVPYLGPVGPRPPEHSHAAAMSDTALLQTWHANPRVREFWGDFQDGGLERALCMRHSFPAMGLWDGVPFGYFEIYWVKEDALGRHVGAEIGDWDRGVHVMIGEEWSRGRVPVWLTGLVHWCLTADFRTMNVCLEPRVDNDRCVVCSTSQAQATADPLIGSCATSRPWGLPGSGRCRSRTSRRGT